MLLWLAMTIYVLRHGIAEDAAPGQADSERRLTQEGERKLRRVLARAREAGVRPERIITSPYVRARATAAIAADELGFRDQLIETDRLEPHIGVSELWDEVRVLAGSGSAMLVGHNPQLSAFVSMAIGCSGYGVEMKKAGLAALDVYGSGPGLRAGLSWLLTPKTAG